VRRRFPRVVRDWVTFPLDEIEQSLSHDLGIKDFLNLKLSLVVDDDRGRRRLSARGNIGLDVPIKERSMKHGVDLHG